MRRALILLAAATLAGPARTQPAPASRPTSPDAVKPLFGAREPEPEDEETAAGRAQPANPEAPPASAEAPSSQAYDARVRQSFAAAQAYQGPLDGGWTLSAKGEGDLYAIRFADKAGRVEAVWRDLRRAGALGASGLVDEVDRTGPRLTLRFSPAAGLADVATLTAGAGGVWSGELDENGRKRAVSLAKTSP